MKLTYTAFSMALASLLWGCSSDVKVSSGVNFVLVDQTDRIVFPADEVVEVRPTIYGDGRSIFFRLSRIGAERFFSLPVGLKLRCEAEGRLIGYAEVTHEIGVGKGGYCLEVTFPDEAAFEIARAALADAQ